MMDLRQARYFVAVFEEGSVTRASRRLHVAQPAVTATIRGLEDRIGQALFRRTARGMVATEAATSLYDLCLPLLRDAARIDEGLTELRGGKLTGSVALGCLPSIPESAVTRALTATAREFARTYPQVRLRLVEGYSVALCEMVRRGLVDGAVLNDPGPQPGLERQVILHEPLCIVQARQGADAAHVAIASLVRNPRVLLPSPRNSLRQLVDRSLAAEGLTIEPAIEVDSISVALALVLEEGYLAVLPRSAVSGRQDIARFSLTLFGDFARDLVLARLATPLPRAAAAFVSHFSRLLSAEVSTEAV